MRPKFSSPRGARRPTASAWMILSLSLAPAAAWGQQPAGTAAPAGPTLTPAQEREARTHFERGLSLYNIQDYDGALAEFQAAYDMSRRPTVLYNLAVTNQALHRYPEALRLVERYLTEGTLTAERRAEVERAREELRGFTGRLRISGLPAGAQVRVDGERVGTAPIAEAVVVGTGRHTVEVSAPGFRDTRETVLVAGGQERDVALTLQAEVVTPTNTQPAAPTSGTLVFSGLPSGAQVQLDGTGVAATQPVTAPVGTHRLAVSAPGRAPWSGTVQVNAGAQRTVRVNLADTSRLPIAAFAATAAFTGVATLAIVGLGVPTMMIGNQYSQLPESERVATNPVAADLASRGNTLKIATNVCIGVAAASAIATVVVATRTQFGAPGRSTVDVAVMPRLDGGVDVGLGGRF